MLNNLLHLRPPYLKKSIISTVLLLMFTACGYGNQEVSNDALNNPLSAEVDKETAHSELPAISFERSVHDFGTIREGDVVATTFRFKNTGKKDLIIQTASGSCGCTVPVFPKTPVAPGKEEEIRVEYNSEGKSGLQEKSVTVVTNCIPNTTTLRIKVMVQDR
ncbi:MAG: DUF1573 domain-containing protein [Sphingomonadales bacterium]|nr:DUF1573 domain-containing protein [Sphingomonadales bacterium]